MERALPPDARADGLTRTDLEDRTLTDVIDDARSLSLFASDRIIWVSSAELALPRRMVAVTEDEEDTKGERSALAGYLKAPSPGTVLVFECSRYDFAGDDKLKMERVEKFFAGVREVVEFRHFFARVKPLSGSDDGEELSSKAWRRGIGDPPGKCCWRWRRGWRLKLRSCRSMSAAIAP